MQVAAALSEVRICSGRDPRRRLRDRVCLLIVKIQSRSSPKFPSSAATGNATELPIRLTRLSKL